ncbi:MULTISPECIES: putative selenate ABC transporter substrate-binding protein [Prochlorococcus]|uniref:ABC-type phosphate/phosphonate transport system periplasmic component n=1 Tax=Prochlorococcus marinus (strain SARG / CCMP1375 / SS120) TaxID=167539 RepID=Q7VBS3_PROMA|nr:MULTISPECIES: putative selenate ABC transporter substrate-binding protein [Prochlorococcus]AAQ00064.1 ABC-type phosphate/phosphonate transport system periplasmic component [Prochlorococcus marinus subsp. marinus str. CCMP1375]KGG13861.1 Phosphonate ABC transporter phosphate-binding periplasmic component [Prochlorococcus marinus str. LG]KGG18994.1 Phosphonate ABC transporter phosphate-binding periplasmic component [Prochlorococcus marinus str. SS2]KGG23466.1 Phosphonate ABC transporter phosph
MKFVLKNKATALLLILFSIFSIDQDKLSSEQLFISAIPDQYPEKLNRLYSLLAKELSDQLNVEVVYKPVINYQAAVSAFRTGDLDLVWFGGLTGVQARLQRPGSIVIAQRDIDAKFHSVFIANTNSGIKPISNIYELRQLKGRRFTFGSESSTSGRLMPQHYLTKANVKTTDFKGGRAGYSGSHDATIVLVQSGSYEAGVLNEQVWKENVSNGKADLKKVKTIWKTPAYADYHWLAQPNLDNKFRPGFTKSLTEKILNLNNQQPIQQEILKLFNATKFVKAYAYQYKDIESIGRELGKIR